MSGFFDVTCAKCHRRFGWSGTAAQMPPCPRCGFQDTLREPAIDEMLDILRRKALEEEPKTKEQQEAYDMGCNDFKPGISKLPDARKGPYEGTCLDRYYRRGFIHTLRRYHDNQSRSQTQ